MIQRFLFPAVAMLLLSCGFAAAQPKEGRRVDDLMHRSGLWVQVGQMQAQIRAGAQMSQAQAATLAEEDFRQLLAAIDFAFAPDRMRAAMSERLADLLPVEDERVALQWLSSSLGERFTRLEEKSGELPAAPGRPKDAEKFAATVPAPRMQKLERLADSIQAGEGGASLMINLASAIVYGVTLASPLADARNAVETVRRRMEGQRAEMAAAMRKSSIHEFALMYRTMSDEELEQYVAFAESPAGKRYHDASIKALDHVITQAAFEMGQRFALLKKEPRRES